ncbi:putative protein phosphatase 2C 55 [Senna tora]|uniref:Protein phosphatase n=1 Tax=Senna tora TaxID=362788 RepID=A0A834W2C2_9FABA|nr:putative protein phosphatase 2C 55 [Senna tora]
MRAVNVGDSGFMIFRKNRLAFRSPVQQRRFNAPYQLGRLKKLDKPDCCVELEIDVEGGDVVVFGTDGVFDNMFGREIESYVRISMNEDGDRMEAEKLAWMIADVALCNSQSKRRRTPFAEEAEKAGRKHAGGKIDDITVLVAYIL